MKIILRAGITPILIYFIATACGSENSSEITSSIKTEADAISLQRALEAEDGQKKPEAGTLEVFTLNEYPAPEALKAKIAAGIRQRKVGPALVSNEEIPTRSKIAGDLNALPAVTKRSDQAGNANNVAKVQTDLSKTPLSGQKLLSIQPAGVISSKGASGLSRTYELTDGSVIEFSEDDYVSAGTKLKLVQESFNTEVNGTLGTISSVRSSDGRGLSTLHWVTPTRSYRLVRVCQENFDARRSEALLAKIATTVPY